MLDNLTNNIKAWTSTAASRAGELTRAAANKAEELSRIGRLKMEVYQLERQEHRYLADLGRITHKLLQEQDAPKVLSDDESVVNLLGKLDDVGIRIKAKQADIEAAAQAEKSAKTEAKAPATAKKQPKAAVKKPAAKRKTSTASKGMTKKTAKPGTGTKKTKTAVKAKAKSKA